jgi:Polysaccharide deacetylase
MSITIALLLFLGLQHLDDLAIYAQSISNGVTNDKVVILNFDDGRKTQFTEAKPILDKYGFKATFYVVCNYIGNKPGYMDWNDVKQLNQEGHDIGSHSMNHFRLDTLSKKDVKFEVAQSKKCLEDHNIHVTSFAYPFNAGSNDKKVVNIVSKYYDLARTADSPLTYLHCDGWKSQSHQNNCRTFSNKDLTFANRYSIRGWSQDKSRMVNSFNDRELLQKFIDNVNSQSNYNDGGAIKAIPIVIYHREGDSGVIDYNTDLKLFQKEMKYLHDNNFRVITMRDLAYDGKTNYLYIKSNNDLSQVGGVASVSTGN